MRKIILFLVSTFIIQVSDIEAQTEKGKIMIGASTGVEFTDFGTGRNVMSLGYSVGTINRGSDQSTDVKSLNLYLAPKIGIFIIDNLALGLDVDLAYGSTTFDSEKHTETILGAGPFVRYYLPIKSVLPFAEINGGYGKYKFKYKSDFRSSSSDWNFLNLGGGVGVAFPVNDHATFDLMISYNYWSRRNVERDLFDKSNSIGLTIGFNFFIGR